MLALFIILVGLTYLVKKCLFPIDAYVVWCPTWSKNLGRYLVWVSDERVIKKANFYFLCCKIQGPLHYSYYFCGSLESSSSNLYTFYRRKLHRLQILLMIKQDWSYFYHMYLSMKFIISSVRAGIYVTFAGLMAITALSWRVWWVDRGDRYVRRKPRDPDKTLNTI